MSERENELEHRIAKLEAENAKLRETEQLLAGRTALAWVGMISSTWRHSIEKHAITIREQTQLIRDKIQTKFDLNDLNDRLDMLERLANQILKKPIIMPLSSEEGLELVNITDLISERISQLRSHKPYSTIEIDLQRPNHPVLARISPEWFKRGLDILVDNSVDAMASSQIKRIEIRVLNLDEKIHVVMEDSGCGIPEDVIPLLFIQPISQNNSKKGLGLGLLMAQMIFHTYGGDLQLTQTNSQGTAFTIVLPKAS